MHHLEWDIDNVTSIVYACCALQNICEQLNDRCDATWVNAIRNEERRRPQPTCTMQRVEPWSAVARSVILEINKQENCVLGVFSCVYRYLRTFLNSNSDNMNKGGVGQCSYCLIFHRCLFMLLNLCCTCLSTACTVMISHSRKQTTAKVDCAQACTHCLVLWVKCSVQPSNDVSYRHSVMSDHAFFNYQKAYLLPGFNVVCTATFGNAKMGRHKVQINPTK